MDENAKRRLVGAAVLVALMVIFVPMLVDDKDNDQLGEPIVIPTPPSFDSRFDASVEPSADEFNRPVPQPQTQVQRQPQVESPPQTHADARDLRPGAVRPAPIEVERLPIKPVAPAPARPTPALAPVQAPTSEKPPSQVSSGVSSSRPETAAKPAGPPPPVPAGAPSWVVQVASLSVEDAATRLRNELRGKGYPAFIEQAKINDATFYRVRVGPEADRARADKMATAIGAETGSAPLVQQYR
ncbi:cell division protein DedD [Thiorhodovibrio winogradskyi]|uniref:Cell division protein DedD n=1 Tax=Thiorhodovibrio winogradskyi TaxID=77007 RepID=A0ABZ0S7R0_9GAMM|nr:SPOR domain-containing protein [Thiorhodovibrio winogradskyi]